MSEPLDFTDRCAHCDTRVGLWLVNPPGGYGQAGISACVGCLAGPLSSLVDRLLENYPPEAAGRLAAAIAEHEAEENNK